MFTEFEKLLWCSQWIQTVQHPLHSILCLYKHLWKTMANHTVLFYKWHLYISPSTVAMAVGVLRADFLESHHIPWLNFFLCRVERSNGNWEKVQTTVLSFWWHSPGQWQIVALAFWLHWHGFRYHQVGVVGPVSGAGKVASANDVLASALPLQGQLCLHALTLYFSYKLWMHSLWKPYYPLCRMVGFLCGQVYVICE